GEWTKVARSVLRLEPRQRKARNRVVEIDLEQQEPFVIAETNVVTGTEFLDQLAFEQQRFRFAADEVNVEIVDRLDQRVEFQVPAQAPRRMKVLAHPLTQITRLADVNHRSEAVLHQVNARLVRQLAQLAADRVRHWHDRNFTQRRAGAKEFLELPQVRPFHERVANQVADS